MGYHKDLENTLGLMVVSIEEILSKAIEMAMEYGLMQLLVAKITKDIIF